MVPFKYLFVAAALFFNMLSHAAEPETGGPGNSITGKVVDQKTGEPVQFATISLHIRSDSSLVTGAIATEQGEFILENLDPETYYVKIDFLGYESLIIDEVELVGRRATVDLGTVQLLESAQKLDEFVVEAEKKLMETKIDRKVYNVSKDANAQGGTGLDALRNVPSVDVDVDNNISLRGDQNVRILVDGRPLNIPADQYLQQLPANAIERVEIITNPSAKYDPEGMSGILNIILKKNQNRGVNGNVSLSAGYGKYHKTNGSTSLNYRTPQLNLYGTLSGGNGKYWNGGTNDRSNLGTAVDDQFTRDEGIRSRQSVNGKLGADFFLNDNNTVYGSVSIRENDGSGENELISDWYLPGTDVLDSSSIRTTDSDQLNSGFNVNAGWQKKFNKPGHRLDIDLLYSEDNNRDENHYTEAFFNEGGEFIPGTVRQNQRTKDQGNLIYNRFDYTLPITDSINLEAGIHMTLTDKTTAFYLEDYVDSLQQFVPDIAQNNVFNFDRDVWAGYTTFGHQVNRFSYKVGLRLEHTTRTSRLENNNTVFNDQYTSLFPSVHLSFKQTPTREFQLSYSRRLNRPRSGQLNPFANFSNPYTIRTGNPFLRPEYVNVYELGYVQYWNKFNLNGTVYHRHMTDMIRRFLSLRSDGISEVTFINQSTSNIYGTEWIISYNPNRKWRNNLSMNYWYSVLSEDSLTKGLQQVMQGFSLQFNSSYSFPNNLSVQLSSRYRGPMEVQQGKISGMFGMDLAARMPVLDKKGSISIRVSDILNTRRFIFESQDLDYNFAIDRRWESQSVYVTFTYSFGKQIKGPQRRRSNSGDVSDDFESPGF